MKNQSRYPTIGLLKQARFISGFTDTWISKLSISAASSRESVYQARKRKAMNLNYTYKMVDTCAGEYDAVDALFLFHV